MLGALEPRTRIDTLTSSAMSNASIGRASSTIIVGMSPDEVRIRFDDISRRHFADPLVDAISVRPCEPATWGETFASLQRECLPRGGGVDLSRLFSAEERERFGELNSTEPQGSLEHRVLFVDGDEVVGCYWGMQESYARYYMIATMIRASHRGRGVYAAFLARLVAIAKEMGFREIYSRHHPDNNAILVPKLKAGFIISSFEITHNFGLLVHLRYPIADALREVYAYRIEASQGAAALEARGVLKR